MKTIRSIKRSSFAIVGFMISLMATTSANSESVNDRVETVQTVEWFVAHDLVRNEILAGCHNNPGELGFTPNCINAQHADSKKTWSARGGIKVAPIEFKRR